MSLSAFFPGSAVGALQGTQEAAEQLIPEEDEAGRDSSLQQAGRQALEESTRALLSHDLPYAVQETPVRPYLERNIEKVKEEKIQPSLPGKEPSPEEDQGTPADMQPAGTFLSTAAATWGRVTVVTSSREQETPSAMAHANHSNWRPVRSLCDPSTYCLRYKLGESLLHTVLLLFSIPPAL